MKIVTADELYSISCGRDWERTYWKISPISGVAVPPVTLFCTVSGMSSLDLYKNPGIRIYGMDVCRFDYQDAPYYYNFDAYSVYTMGVPGQFSIIGPYKPDYHHSSTIPLSFNITLEDLNNPQIIIGI